MDTWILYVEAGEKYSVKTAYSSLPWQRLHFPLPLLPLSVSRQHRSGLTWIKRHLFSTSAATSLRVFNSV